MVDSTNTKAIFKILEKKLAKYKKKWGDVFPWLPPPFYVQIAKFNFCFFFVLMVKSGMPVTTRNNTEFNFWFNLSTFFHFCFVPR